MIAAHIVCRTNDFPRGLMSGTCWLRGGVRIAELAMVNTLHSSNSSSNGYDLKVYETSMTGTRQDCSKELMRWDVSTKS
jgi:hypothetical protein